MADQRLADLPSNFDADIPAYVVRPSRRRNVPAQARAFSLKQGMVKAATWWNRLTDAWQQARAEARDLSSTVHASQPYFEVSVRETRGTAVFSERNKRFALAGVALAGLLTVGLALSTQQKTAQTPAIAQVSMGASSLIASQNLAAKLVELEKHPKAPGAVPAKRTAAVTYVIQAGDTLTGVGAKFGISGRTVRLANDLPFGYRLPLGKKLIIPPSNGAYHRVQAGETLSRLSARYGISQSALLAANPGLRPNRMALDQKVFIPGATDLKQSATSAPAKEARGYRKGAWAKRLTASRSLVGQFGARVGALSLPAVGQDSSPFGARGTSFHPGMDISNRIGTPIQAAKGGVVVLAGWNGAYGKCVDIDHGGGVITRYGHCSEVLVKPGQEVEVGQLIAKMGSTGRSTGPHVHFEVRIQGRAVNPTSFL